MSNHVVKIETASVDLDYNDILENIEDTITARISDMIGDEAWDAVEYQVNEAVSDHEGVGIAFEQAVWKAICRLDNPNVADEVWAAAAKEYLLSVTPKDTSSEAWVAAAKGAVTESNVRAIVILEMRRAMKGILSEMNVSLEAAQEDGSIVLVESREGQTLEEWQKEMAELRKRARESGAEIAVAPGD